MLTIGRHINKIPGMSDQEAQNPRELEEFVVVMKTGLSPFLGSRRCGNLG